MQKIVQVVYAAPEHPFPADELVRQTKLTPDEVEGTLEHLIASGMLTRLKAAADQPATVSANRDFVFYRELRSIALKSFAAGEPIRAMLRSKFKDSVVRAFILGEDEDHIIELLVVHGASTPDAAAMAAACRKLSKTLLRHLQVHVIPHARLERPAPGDALIAKLASPAAFEIIATGDTKARLAGERVGLLQSARRKLAALARPRNDR